MCVLTCFLCFLHPQPEHLQSEVGVTDIYIKWVLVSEQEIVIRSYEIAWSTVLSSSLSIRTKKDDSREYARAYCYRGRNVETTMTVSITVYQNRSVALKHGCGRDRIGCALRAPRHMW